LVNVTVLNVTSSHHCMPCMSVMSTLRSGQGRDARMLMRSSASPRSRGEGGPLIYGTPLSPWLAALSAYLELLPRRGEQLPGCCPASDIRRLMCRCGRVRRQYALLQGTELGLGGLIARTQCVSHEGVSNSRRSIAYVGPSSGQPGRGREHQGRDGAHFRWLLAALLVPAAWLEPSLFSQPMCAASSNLSPAPCRHFTTGNCKR